MTEATISQLVDVRNVIYIKQKELYLSTISNINVRNRELLKNDFGSTLVKNCAWDAADAIVDKYFHTADFYVSPQQMYDRIICFSYENDQDFLADNAALRKMLYENQTSKDELKEITKQCEEAGKYLFGGERNKDPIDRETKAYRNRREKDGTLVDDITGEKGTSHTVIKNGKEEQVSDLHADHIQARDSIKYDSQYINSSRLDDMKAFAYSDHNFWLIHASANTAKGAVRVIKKDNDVFFMSNQEYKNGLANGDITEKNDITWKASADQLADATIAMWEKETNSGHKFEKLKEVGYLDENGKVKPEARQKLREQYQKSMNAESLHTIFPYKENDEWKMPWLDYEEVVKSAASKTKSSLKKIIAGQVVYYVLPPMVFETQRIIRKRDITLDSFFKEIKDSGKRIVRYVSSKMKDIFKNVFGNTLNRFLKNLLDIIIEVIKETVKRALKVVKQFVLSIVNCIKVLRNKESSPPEKADAVTRILAVTVASVALEVLFELAEKEFGLPDILMEPLQIIVTIIVTNLIMLILQKADLFNVKYGLLVANIDRVFEEEFKKFQVDCKLLEQESDLIQESIMDSIKKQLEEIKRDLDAADPYENDMMSPLNHLNNIFDMGIDYQKEWCDFVGGATTC